MSHRDPYPLVLGAIAFEARRRPRRRSPRKPDAELRAIGRRSAITIGTAPQAISSDSRETPLPNWLTNYIG